MNLILGFSFQLFLAVIIICFDVRHPHRVFMHDTKDNNGSIENEELRGFLKDLLELAKKVSD